MVRLGKGDSVYILLRYIDASEDDEGNGVEIFGVYSSEDAAGCYLDKLDEQGVNIDDFDVVERALDIDADADLDIEE